MEVKIDDGAIFGQQIEVRSLELDTVGIIHGWDIAFAGSICRLFF
jgi:hypothetical protein